jgi:uncharacterized alpha-E superfamily protein
MLSRVAESIYWMSRQVERAENLARFLEVTHNLILDQPEDLVDPWAPLIQVTADQKLFDERFDRMDVASVTQFLAFDDTYANSMIASLWYARENARSVRESLSSETFEQLNEFYYFVRDAAVDPSSLSPAKFFDSVRRFAIRWTGVLDSTMSRNMVWHFANVGRLLERADKTSRILDVKYFNILPQLEDVGTAVDDLQWSALLSAISGFEPYRSKHRLIRVPSVVEFFLFNSTFPRSVLFCVEGACDSLSRIESMSSDASDHTALQLVRELQARLASADVEVILSQGMHEFIDKTQTEINAIGIAMNQDYFHSAVTS